jgi:hypothetical protein
VGVFPPVPAGVKSTDAEALLKGLLVAISVAVPIVTGCGIVVAKIDEVVAAGPVADGFVAVIANV